MTPFAPPAESQDAIIAFSKQCYGVLNQQWNIREQMRQIDLAYLRESDLTTEAQRARIALKRGDASKFRNITIPIVMPQVESAVAYQQSVFLQGYPIFATVAAPGLEDAAQQMDTIIGEQQVYANWVPEILKALRNGFKYNCGPCEVEWCKEVTYTLDTAVSYKQGKEGQPTQQIWEGNKFKALDPYNTFWDTRVKLSDLPEWGEFVGYTELMSRIRLKKYLAALPTRINVTQAFESGMGAISSGQGSGQGNASYYIPSLNPEALLDLSNLDGTNWAAWAGLVTGRDSAINYRNLYEVTVLYARILPSDFGFKGVPGPNIPQVWKFILVNGQVVVYCERMTNAHNLLPVLFAVPLDDGLGYQTKSYAKNVEPFQEITSALSNSSIAARRRAISDRVLYDPSRISSAAINNDSPNAKIPVRPSAFQTELSKAVYAFPFRDDQFQINGQEMQQYAAMANQVSGLNPARQGQFVKGNKTRSEFETVMGNSNGRDQTLALMLEGNFFAPAKVILKNNILQYQGDASLYNRETGELVKVDPITLRQATLAFKLSDGLLPSDKLIDADTLATVIQTLGQSQQLAGAYNIGPMFSYLMKSRGARISGFEKSQPQQAFEQAMSQWTQSVQALVQYFGKIDNPPKPDEIQKLLPPQPKPADYGYDPKATAKAQDKGGLLQQVSAFNAPPPPTAGGAQ